MDEPTTGLDPQSRRIVWEKITELKKNGITILLTTHYMEEAQRLCDRVVVMSLGEKVADEAPELLIRNTMGEEILEIESADPAWQIWKAGLSEGLESFDHGSKAYVYCRACLRDTLGELAVKHKLREFSVRKANLEDVYLKLTGEGLT
jgi:lipooligosaccharide transport system ATP-binding protein